MGRMHQPEVHHRHQALPAGNELGILSQLGCELQRLVERRGSMIFKAGGFISWLRTTLSTLDVPLLFSLITALV